MEKWPKLFAPKTLKEDDLWGEVVPIRGFNDFKPNIVAFNEKELLLFVSHEHFESSFHHAPNQSCTPHVAHVVMYRSPDGGKTWESRGHISDGEEPYSAGEPFATVIDDVLFLNIGCRILRSEDKGNTWERIPMEPETLGLPQDAVSIPARNLIKLKDGSIGCSAWILGEKRDYGFAIWMTSKDKGKTWTATRIKEEATFTGNYVHTSMCEAFLFRTAKTNRLMAISRIVWARLTEETLSKLTHVIEEETESDIDQTAGMLLLESEDEGLTWKPLRGLGYLGMMYPGVAYYNDSDFVLTYTQRVSSTNSPYPHIGVQAVLGHENDDGSIDVDFDHDVIIIDDRTPDYSTEGGCFGVTRVLSDGSFITPYSYRVNKKELDDVLKDGSFASDEVFWRYFENTGMHGHCPNYECYRDASTDLKKHLLIACMGKEQGKSRLVTGVLRWGLKG